MKIIIFQGVINWAEEVGVEVGKGRVEVVDEDQVEVDEEEVVDVVEVVEEVVEDLRSNARHSSNPPALPGDNHFICQLEYTLVGMWRKNRANLWQTHPAKNFQKSFVGKVNWKNLLFEFTSCMEKCAYLGEVNLIHVEKT